MSRVEQRLQVALEPELTAAAVTDKEKTQILAIAEQLAAPEAAPETRRSLFEQMRALLERSSQIAGELAIVKSDLVMESTRPP